MLALAGCGSPGPEGVYKLGQPYQIAGRWYYPEYDPGYDAEGIASWYGRPFHGRPTANGETFDRDQLSAAHPTLPLPSIVRVTNLANRRQLDLRVNDRGPFVGDRLIDLSQAAARKLGFERQGIARVRIQFLSLAEAKGDPPRANPRPYARPAPPAREPTPAPKLPAAAPVLVAAASSAQCSGHFIQVAAFAEPERARRAAARLHGVTLLPVATAPPESDRLTRVRLGPIQDARAVAAALDQLRQSGYAGAFIVADAAPGPFAC